LPIDPRAALARLIRAHARSEEGAAAVLVALLLTVLLVFVAFGTDIAVIYRDRAQLQTYNDLAALGTAADLDDADARIAEMLDGNGLDASAVQEVQFGRYLRNPAIARDARFQPLDQGAPGVNAVALRLRSEAPLTFGQLVSDDDSVPLWTTATASRTGAASFTLGSRFLSMDPAALSALLSQQLNAAISLSLADQSVLASARIDTTELMEALASRLAYDPLNPADVLTLRPSLSDLVRSMIDVLPAGLSAQLAQFTTLPASIQVEIGDIFAADDRELGLTLTEFLSEAEVTALDVLLAAADAADGTSTSELTVSASNPALLSIDASLALHERPADSGWVAIGEEGTTLHSAAVRVATDIEIAPSILGSLGVGVTATRLEIPLYLELAGATATLTELDCAVTAPTDVIARFSTSHRPLSPTDGVSLAVLHLGEFDTSALSTGGALDRANLDYADFLDVSLSLLLTSVDLTVQIRSSASVGESRVDQVAYTSQDWETGNLTRRFGTGNLLGTAIGALLSPDAVDIRVNPADQGLVSSALSGLVNTLLALLPERLLATLATPLDAALDGALDAAGLSLGEGELTLTGYHCERVQLVQ
jgi:uncharacterized membrane protein